MEFLAISGSARSVSTNTAMLRALAKVAPDGHSISVFDDVTCLPVFSPDLEGNLTPPQVLNFAKRIDECDGLIIASPEYVRAIPGGLKNAIDWLVSREEIISKPIVLAHASHRGEDMLAQLRSVLSTVSERFNEDVFLKFELMAYTPEAVFDHFEVAENRISAEKFLLDFIDYCSL